MEAEAAIESEKLRIQEDNNIEIMKLKLIRANQSFC